MAEETISIIKIQTGEAVESVKDLRENIKELKNRLNDLAIGSEEYQDTLDELKINQNALKDAMHATSSSMDEVVKSATGANIEFDKNNNLVKEQTVSYNALVHEMANLKEAWRSTTDEQNRAQLGQRINEINNELKDLDASVGNYSRNVGDYTNSIKKALGDFPRFADPAKKAIKDVNDTASLLSSNPVMGVIALITPLVAEITRSLKEDESSMTAINKVMNTMKPVMDFFKGVLGQVVKFLTEIIERAADFLGNSGIFSQIVEGVVGVGNAIFQFIIAPFKAVAEAIKVFREEGVKGIGNAAKAFANEMKSGVAFKSNFKAGQSMADAIISGAKSKTEEVKESGQELGNSLADGLKASLADIDKALAEGQKKIDAIIKAAQDAQKEIDELVQDEADTVTGEVNAVLDELNRLEEEKRKKMEEISAARITTMFEVAGATSSILGTIADMYESDEENSEKNANKVKALRIASATVDTISGAIGAFMQAVQTIPPPFGAIVGGAQAAAVTAAGMANIAKIRSTKIGKSSTSSSSVSAPAITNAPTVGANLPQVRNVTSASEEDRLNQMASEQRVVLVMSDLEIKQNQVRTQVAEASF